jgi:hypothetical protein
MINKKLNFNSKEEFREYAKTVLKEELENLLLEAEEEISEEEIVQNYLVGRGLPEQLKVAVSDKLSASDKQKIINAFNAEKTIIIPNVERLIKIEKGRSVAPVTPEEKEETEGQLASDLAKGFLRAGTQGGPSYGGGEVWGGMGFVKRRRDFPGADIDAPSSTIATFGEPLPTEIREKLPIERLKNLTPEKLAELTLEDAKGLLTDKQINVLKAWKKRYENIKKYNEANPEKQKELPTPPEFFDVLLTTLNIPRKQIVIPFKPTIAISTTTEPSMEAGEVPSSEGEKAGESKKDKLKAQFDIIDKELTGYRGETGIFTPIDRQLDLLKIKLVGVLANKEVKDAFKKMPLDLRLYLQDKIFEDVQNFEYRSILDVLDVLDVASKNETLLEDNSFIAFINAVKSQFETFKGGIGLKQEKAVVDRITTLSKVAELLRTSGLTSTAKRTRVLVKDLSNDMERTSLVQNLGFDELLDVVILNPSFLRSTFGDLLSFVVKEKFDKKTIDIVESFINDSRKYSFIIGEVIEAPKVKEPEIEISPIERQRATQEAVGKELGLSRDAVRDIEFVALQKIDKLRSKTFDKIIKTQQANFAKVVTDFFVENDDKLSFPENASEQQVEALNKDLFDEFLETLIDNGFVGLQIPEIIKGLNPSDERKLINYLYSNAEDLVFKGTDDLQKRIDDQADKLTKNVNELKATRTKVVNRQALIELDNLIKEKQNALKSLSSEKESLKVVDKIFSENLIKESIVEELNSIMDLYENTLDIAAEIKEAYEMADESLTEEGLAGEDTLLGELQRDLTEGDFTANYADRLFNKIMEYLATGIAKTSVTVDPETGKKVVEPDPLKLYGLRQKTTEEFMKQILKPFKASADVRRTFNQMPLDLRNYFADKIFEDAEEFIFNPIPEIFNVIMAASKDETAPKNLLKNEKYVQFVNTLVSQLEGYKGEFAKAERYTQDFEKAINRATIAAELERSGLGEKTLGVAEYQRRINQRIKEKEAELKAAKKTVSTMGKIFQSIGLTSEEPAKPAKGASKPKPQGGQKMSRAERELEKLRKMGLA